MTTIRSFAYYFSFILFFSTLRSNCISFSALAFLTAKVASNFECADRYATLDRCRRRTIKATTRSVSSSLSSSSLSSVSLTSSSGSLLLSRKHALFAITHSVFLTTLASPSQPTFASGGATAGKYTTIPIAKRRYYGRVQQAVHEFLVMGPIVLKGDMTAKSIQDFFDVNKVVIVPGKSQSINGQCTTNESQCTRKEIRNSRYNDMKTSMYLLANAFRINQQKPPDNLPTVKAAKAFFQEMDAMETCIRKADPNKKDSIAVQHYLTALEILDSYLDLVELPPTDSGHYDQEFDTLVGESARIT